MCFTGIICWFKCLFKKKKKNKVKLSPITYGYKPDRPLNYWLH